MTQWVDSRWQTKQPVCQMDKKPPGFAASWPGHPRNNKFEQMIMVVQDLTTALAPGSPALHCFCMVVRLCIQKARFMALVANGNCCTQPQSIPCSTVSYTVGRPLSRRFQEPHFEQFKLGQQPCSTQHRSQIVFLKVTRCLTHSNRPQQDSCQPELTLCCNRSTMGFFLPKAALCWLSAWLLRLIDATRPNPVSFPLQFL